MWLEFSSICHIVDRHSLDMLPLTFIIPLWFFIPNHFVVFSQFEDNPFSHYIHLVIIFPDYYHFQILA